MDKAFQDIRLNIPKAPALTLLLERPVFGHYNKQNPSGVISYDDYNDEIQHFKKKFIYEGLIKEELETVYFLINYRRIFMNGVDW
jgi:tRNA pseudouridine38-40 synthase